MKHLIGERILTAHARLVTLCRNLSLFQTQCESYVLLKHMCEMAPGQPHCYVFPGGKGHGPLFCGTRGICAGQCPCISCQEGPASHGGLMPTTEGDLALCPRYVSKVLCHPMLKCTVFFLATPTPRAMGRSVRTPTPDVR